MRISCLKCHLYIALRCYGFCPRSINVTYYRLSYLITKLKNQNCPFECEDFRSKSELSWVLDIFNPFPGFSSWDGPQNYWQKLSDIGGATMIDA